MSNRNRFITGLSFGIIMSIFFIIQNLVTNNSQTTNEILISIGTGLLGGFISGFLYGWIIGLFAKSKFVSDSTKIVTEPGETILFETPANHFVGKEGVGGKLFLTNQRLIFKSHNLNIQNHMLAIDLSDVKKVDRYNVLGVVNNGLSVTTENDRAEKYVVEQVDEWITRLPKTVSSVFYLCVLCG